MTQPLPTDAPLASLHVLQAPDGGMALGYVRDTGWVIFAPRHDTTPTDILQALGYGYVRQIHAMRRLVGDPEPQPPSGELTPT